MSVLPDPDALHPIVLPDGTPHAGTVHLSSALDHPNIEVGAFSYASQTDSPDSADGWAARLAPYLYPGAPDRLVIGRYCQIASGTVFVTASANHATRGISTYPFPVFSPDRMRGYAPDARDTVVGHDVWLGMGVMVCPGAQIGSGVIVGAGSVVRGTVPPYAVVQGNPARVVRMRFDERDIARLLELAWWDWPREAVERAIPALEGGDLTELERLRP